MGIKRPLDVEEFPEPSFSLPKPLDYNKRLNLNIDESHISTPKADFPGGAKNAPYEFHYDEPLEHDEPDDAYTADREFEPSAPFSLVSSSSSEEEDCGEGPTSFWPYFPENDFSIPRRPTERFQNSYISLLYGPPRKEVPVGPDYQAQIPTWDPSASQKELPLMGTRIISMPDINDSTLVGLGRAACTCLDTGSMRCVQQHVKEAREKLLDSVGPENFVKLGLDEMGEEVARKWGQDEERAFHEIVLSNRVVFWEHLRAEFPARTMREFVSYYFNVFMLRRRAAQNRSFVLEVDSDDDERREEDLDSVYNDEAPGQNGECYFFCGVEDGDDDKDDDGSMVKSLGDGDLDASWMDEFWAEPGKVEGNNKAGKQENSCSADVDVEKKDGFGRENEVSRRDDEKVHDEPEL
ncbi:ELM2 domain-containing protein [Striga hermonthica]|uniref:ELM2 domain-containing protein n=1 Tax=Striga hermonthica TaxID=68872 RepID=A0A9N7NPM0_STRHE|nr:ELM2 domain-containing protein [Striga hermonthica]